MPHRDPNQAKEYRRKYRAANRERLVAEGRTWARAHPERRAESNRKYAAGHKEECAERLRQWRAVNPDKRRAQECRARLASPARRALYAARHRHGVTDEAEYLRVWHLPCACCGQDVAGGVDRIDSSGTYEPGNMQAMCGPCNYAKRDMPQAVFLAWRHRVYAQVAAELAQQEECN